MVLQRLNRPVDASSLAMFRIAFGAAMVAAALRFFSHGWIAADYLKPHHFFHYWGLSFIRPLPGVGMYVLYGAIAISAALISIGFCYRAACLVFVTSFTYAHLCDQANYLNHYYLVSLLGLLMLFLPLDRTLSLRVVLRPAERRDRIRAWMLWLLRFQIAVVYVFGAIAKMGSDWLLRAEPMRIWLAADAELPLLGHLARRAWFPLAMSWCGLCFDLCIVPLLLWPRTRRAAYGVVVIFHVLTSLLFQIGMFPWIMIVSATLFFESAWPRRFLRGIKNDGIAGAQLSTPIMIVIGAYALIQIAMPLRHLLYPGNTLWTEEGFRYAWRVMLIEKSGDLELRVEHPDGHSVFVSPRDYLSPFQARMVSTQPDMILQLAHIVADDYDERGRGPVKIYAEAQVSWNGRLHTLMIDPKVDLAQEVDGLGSKRWILPAPTTEPSF